MNSHFQQVCTSSHSDHVLSDVGDRVLINMLLAVLIIAVLIDTLTPIAVGVGFDMLTDVKCTVLNAVVIVLEFVVPL